MAVRWEDWLLPWLKVSSHLHWESVLAGIAGWRLSTRHRNTFSFMFFQICIACFALFLLRASMDIIRQSCKVPHKDTLVSSINAPHCIMTTNPFRRRNSEKCCTNTSVHLLLSFSAYITSHKSMTQCSIKSNTETASVVFIKALWNALTTLYCPLCCTGMFTGQSHYSALQEELFDWTHSKHVFICSENTI